MHAYMYAAMHWCTHSPTSAPIHAHTYLSSLPLRGLPPNNHLLTHLSVSYVSSASHATVRDSVLTQLCYDIPCSLTRNADKDVWTVEQGNLPRLILLQSSIKQAFILKPAAPLWWQAFPCFYPFTSALTHAKALSVAIRSTVGHLSDDSGCGEGDIQNWDCTTTPVLAAPLQKHT